MSARPGWVSSVARVLLATGALGGGALAYAGLYEVNAYRLRRVEVPVLPAGSAPIRVLHISDLHLTPGARRGSAGCRGWPRWSRTWWSTPATTSRTRDAVAFVLRSLGRLLDVPGVFVWGSNDYYAPTFKNPLRYLTERGEAAATRSAQAAVGGSRAGLLRSRAGST